jgi:O-antigen/teichoic acid export membrane protein/glycosyltransferase involved in cell wall biosynthesis
LPLVSILIPAYNSADCILEAIQAAQAQTLTDIEIIVIDDASTDSTTDLVAACALGDPRIQLCRLPVNSGPAAARNFGISIANGDWLALLDADDTMDPNRLERLLEQAGDDDVLLADNLAMYDLHADKIVKLGIDPSLLGAGLRLGCEDYVARCKTNQPDSVDFGLLKPLIRASHIRKHCIHYDERSRYGEDFRFYLDALLYGGLFHIVPDALYRYTERTGSISGKHSGLSKTCARYDQLESQAIELAKDPFYASVATHLLDRAAAIRRLAKVAKFGRHATPGKIARLPLTLADSDMRSYLALRLRQKLANLRSASTRGTLLHDASNLCLGQGIKLVLQAIYFVCIARSLGPAQYGAFVAITAMTGIISPYVGFGCGTLFLKNVRSGKRTAPVCWGNGLFSTLVSGLLTTGLLSALSRFWLPAFPVKLAIAICLSDLILMRVIDLASFGFAASGRMSKTAVQNTTMSLLRVIGIVFLGATQRQVTVQQWTGVYFLTGVIGALFALQQGTSLWGRPQICYEALWKDTREGCFFSISTSAQTIYNDIDKTMLARLSTFSATGVYAAAYRIIDTSLTPVRSLVSAAYPQFFRIGADGIDATYGYAQRLIRKALIYGIADFLGLMLVAPLLPHLLGAKYASVTPAIQLLAVIPVMRCVHWFLADALSGANAQALRTAVQVGVAVLNVVLNLAILPRWSWVGAAWTSVISDAALMAGVYLAIHWKISVNAVQRTSPVSDCQ